MRVGFLTAAILVLLVEPRFLRAQQQYAKASLRAPLRAMVWLKPETDEVLERIRGQTNDLDVELLVSELDPIPDRLGSQLRDAYALSERQKVSLVIWFVKQPDEEHHFMVHIAIPETRRLLTRDLGPSEADSSSTKLSSAVKESAALVVRAALQAVLSGATIGEVQSGGFDDNSNSPTASASEPAPTATPAHDGQPEAAREAAKEGPNPPPASRETSTLKQPTPRAPPELNGWPWSVGFEGLVQYDGAGSGVNNLAECTLLRMQRRLVPFVAFIAGSACLPREIGSAYGTIHLGRQQAVIGAKLILLQTAVELSLGAQAGAVFYERETRYPRLGVTAGAPKVYPIGTLGPEFRLLVPAQRSRLQAGFAVGMDFLTNSLSIGYTVPGSAGVATYAQAVRIGNVQPYAALGLALRL